MVVIKDLKFLISEDKGRQTAEENWEAIKLVNPQASSRVTLKKSINGTHKISRRPPMNSQDPKRGGEGRKGSVIKIF